MRRSALDRAVEDFISRDNNSFDDSDDFDRKVAALIVQEARDKNDALARGASSSSRGSVPRHHTNTRFLNSVIRDVQSHNKTVLNNVPSHTESDKDNRGSGRSQSRTNGSNGEFSRTDGKMRAWSDEEAASVMDGRDVSRDKRRKSDLLSSEDEERHHRQRRKHSERRKGEYEREDRSISPRHESYRGAKSDGRRSRHGKPSKEDVSRKQGDLADASPPSKMDRYFSKNYDPMLDVKADVRQDDSGLVEDDGWDRMLAALKEKEERKKLRKKGSRHKSKESKPSVGTNLLDTRYHGRGALREWDKGKEALH